MPLYHTEFSSDCSILEVGCFLKIWNGSSWVNADSYSGVVSGKFSDGTNCYTVSSGVITAKDQCRVDIYMNICADTQADGSGYVSVRLQAQDTSNYSTGTLTAVNTNVTVNFTINGADSGQITDSITITNGNTNNGPIGFGPGFGSGELVSSIVIDSISPASSGNYYYNTGSTNIGSC